MDCSLYSDEVIPQTAMAIFMLMLFSILTYTLCVREGINWTQFLSLLFSWPLNLVHLARTLLVFEFPLGNSETSPCYVLVHPSKIVPPPGAPLRQIQFTLEQAIKVQRV
jgi:hypothetical protein